MLDSCFQLTYPVYRCGSNKGWSSLFFFTALRDGTDWSPRLVIYGDMGNENAQSLGRLQIGAQKGSFDAILHVGELQTLCISWDCLRYGTKSSFDTSLKGTRCLGPVELVYKKCL